MPSSCSCATCSRVHLLRHASSMTSTSLRGLKCSFFALRNIATRSRSPHQFISNAERPSGRYQVMEEVVRSGLRARTWLIFDRLGKTISTLVVGPDEREFPVHQKRLYESSPYFAAAAKEDWKEGQEHRIPLPDDNTLAVGLYIQWIYSGKIFTRPGNGGIDDKVKSTYDETCLLVEGFLFGEKIQDDDFRDAIVDSIIVSIDDPGKDDRLRYPSGSTVDRVYEGTPERSPLRRLMVDLYVRHGDRRWIDKVTNIDFLKDLAEDLYIEKMCPSGSDPVAMHRKGCGYHQHVGDRLCYSDTA